MGRSEQARFNRANRWRNYWYCYWVTNFRGPAIEKTPKFALRKVIMVLPGSVKVAGVRYHIEEVEEIIDDPTMMGHVWYQKSIIRIKKDLSPDKKMQTLVHELLHACFYEAGFEEQDEDMVNRLGVVLHQVLVDNKSLEFEDRK